jgi:hypothetical protein
VTNDPEEAARLVALGSPVVLVGKDEEVLATALARCTDRGQRERFLGVMVGDPDDQGVAAAALEMAGELWRWAEQG